MSGAYDRLRNRPVAHTFGVSAQRLWHGRECGLVWRFAYHSARKL